MAAERPPIPWHAQGRPFHALIPRAERIHLDDVGHVPMYDDPQLVSDTILNHTRRLAPWPTEAEGLS